MSLASLVSPHIKQTGFSEKTRTGTEDHQNGISSTLKEPSCPGHPNLLELLLLKSW